MTDYQRIERAIRYLQENFRRQPSFDELAAQVHLSPFHFQRLFARWAGVTPKKFLQSLTLEAAKTQMQSGQQPLLEVSEQLGLSSASRLHDHFVQLEGVTPGQYRQLGRDLQIAYGVGDTPFGPAWVAVTERGICQLWFDDHLPGTAFRLALCNDWPEAELVHDDAGARQTLRRIFATESGRAAPVSVLVRGTNFQVQVWRALLRIPFGQLASYAEIAQAAGKSSAVRAVGSAVGANPVAFLIPCHRVIRQNSELGGYRGGLPRKQAMLVWENLQSANCQQSG